MRVTCPNEYETLAKSTIMFQIETDVKETDTCIYGTLFDQDGVFGFLNWFSKFLLLSLSPESIFMIPVEMFIFNLEICAPLVKICKYGTDSFPWLEAMIYNFTKVFRLVWTNSQSSAWTLARAEFVSPVATKHSTKLVLTLSVIPRHNKAEVCGQCHKRIAKTPKLFPVCFQGCDPQSFPREVARMERPESEWTKSVTKDHIDSCKRNIVLVCSAKCMMNAMSQMNPALYEMCHYIPRLLGKITDWYWWYTKAGFHEDKYQEFMYLPESERLEKLKFGVNKFLTSNTKEIKYFNLKCIVETVYPQGQIKVVNGSLEIDNKSKIKKETTLTVKTPTKFVSACHLPSPEDEARAGPGTSGGLPANIGEHISNMLLHPRKQEAGCAHSLVWGGWARFHPLHDMAAYTEQNDEEGFSKTCLNFQLMIETCEQIDLKLLHDEEKLKLTATLNAFRKNTIHLFPLYLLESHLDYLRDSCLKVAVSGPSNLDDVALDKMFTMVPSVLGLWQGCKNGIIICKSLSTYFAFVPQCPDEFYKFLTFNYHEMPFIRAIPKVFTNRYPDLTEVRRLISKRMAKAGLPEASQHSLKYSLFAFGVMDMIAEREKFEDIIKESDKRVTQFEAIHQKKSNNDVYDILYNDTDNGLTRYSPRHLIGCPHNLLWSGSITFSGVGEEESEQYVTSGWAHGCRCLAERLGSNLNLFSREIVEEVVERQQILIQIQMLKDIYVMMIASESDDCKNEIEDSDNSSVIILFELGSIQKQVVDHIKDRSKLAVACVQISDQGEERFIIRFYYAENKLYGRVVPDKLRPMYEQKIANKIKQMLVFQLVKADDKLIMENMSTLYNSNKVPPLDLLPDLDLERVLWAGQLQCLDSCPPAQPQLSAQLRHLARASLVAAVRRLGEEDVGCVRNPPLVAASGHAVYSLYSAVTTTTSLPPHVEAFFGKARETAICLVAINVDRKMIENIIGTFKKCLSVKLHMQDGTYLEKELRDQKKTLLACFLEKDELIFDVLKMSPSEATKRFVILKYDFKANSSSLYFPKDKEKMSQIWKSFSKSPLMATHEKMLKKLRRHEKQGAAVNIKTVIAKHSDSNNVETVAVISCEPVKKSTKHSQQREMGARKKVSSDEQGNGKPSTLSNDLSQNLKKMFLTDSEKEKPKSTVAAHKSGSAEEKICWNCHASPAAGAKLLKCQGCRRARYCSAPCHAADWERHGGYCAARQRKRREKQGEDSSP